MGPMEFDVAVVSDVHLGAHNSRVAAFLAFLEQVRTDELVIAGDLVDRPDAAGRLRAPEREVIEALRALSRRVRVVWLRGNHDPAEGSLLGPHATFADECVVRAAGKRYLVRHGDVWDRSMQLPRCVIASADFIYHTAQWLDPTHRLARNLKRGSKRFCRSIEMIQQRAVDAAGDMQFDGVILGHSHVARSTTVSGVHYLNSGCWTEVPSSFVGIRGGRARRYYWESLCRRPTHVRQRTMAAANCAVTFRPEFDPILAREVVVP